MTNYSYKGLFVFTIFMIFFVATFYRMATVADVTPCSPRGFPGRCYHISERMCQSIWTTSETTCKQFAKGLELPPGRLIGPFLFRCQLTTLDKASSFSRVWSSDCNEMFRDLEEWQRRNAFN